MAQRASRSQTRQWWRTNCIRERAGVFPQNRTIGIQCDSSPPLQHLSDCLCLAGGTSPLHSSPRRPDQVGVPISTALTFRSASETAATANYKNRASLGCRVLWELFLLAQGHLSGVLPSYNPKPHLAMPEDRRLGWLQRARPALGSPAPASTRSHCLGQQPQPGQPWQHSAVGAAKSGSQEQQQKGQDPTQPAAVLQETRGKTGVSIFTASLNPSVRTAVPP